MSIYVTCLQTYYTNLYHTIPSPSLSIGRFNLMSGIRWICTAILWPDVYFTYFITFPLHFWLYMIRFLQLNLKRTLSRRTIGTLELLSPAHIFGVQHSERKLPQRNGTEWKGSDLCSFVNVYIYWTFFFSSSLASLALQNPFWVDRGQKDAPAWVILATPALFRTFSALW